MLREVTKLTQLVRQGPGTIFLGCLPDWSQVTLRVTTLSSTRPTPLGEIDDMVDGGAFGLAPGQWTDDTVMALRLVASLIERDGFDP